MEIINHRHIPIISETDILVVGAGSAGCVAAVTAAQSSHSVMLIEKYGFPGGSSTQMLDTFYGFFTPGEAPKKIVGGIPDVVVNELDKTADVFLRPNTYGAGTGVTYNPERLKLIWDQLIVEAGVRYLLHTSLVDVVRKGEDPVVCICWNRNGFGKILARKVIDASGDAAFCHLAGFAYETAGEAEPAQSMTTTFRMNNVDLKKFEAAGGKRMLNEKMKHAFETGTYALPRREGSVHEMTQKGCVSTVAVKVVDLSALDTEELTTAEIRGRQQAFTYESFFRHEVPGYGEAKIIGLSHQIGVRETRRVYGEYRLTREDCLSAQIPADTILLCGAPIEDHRKAGADGRETVWEYIPEGGVYGVPYGTIVPSGSHDTWAVGRCFSATHDAHASCRSMAQTMSMGQAAGLAAVLSLDTDMPATGVDIDQLQQRLRRAGAVLEIPESLADTGRNGWSNNV